MSGFSGNLGVPIRAEGEGPIYHFTGLVSEFVVGITGRHSLSVGHMSDTGDRSALSQLGCGSSGVLSLVPHTPEHDRV